MKQLFKHLTALLLALSMALSLLCTSVWAAEVVPEDESTEPVAEEIVEAPVESAQAVAEPEAVEEETTETEESETGESGTEGSEQEGSGTEESGTGESGTEESGTEESKTEEVASGNCGDDVNWSLDNLGTLTISGTGEITDSSWRWSDVSGSILSVVIEEGVTSIGEWAFYDCSNLTSVTIPASVTSIGEWAFSDCSNLTAITVDAGNPNYSAQDGVLFDKDKTTLLWYPAGKEDTSYTIPGTVTSIGYAAFDECSNLTGVTIPDSVTSIGNYAFVGCESLTSVTIPDSVTSIGEWAFGNCFELTSVTLPEGLTEIGAYTFVNCHELTGVTIPNGVTSIGWGAFYNCRSLTGVTIPASVTTIGDYAFGYITNEETLEDIVKDGFTISGYTGSAAETYARNNELTFDSLGTVPFVADLSDCEISLSSTSYTYNGKAKTPAVTVKYNDKELVQDTDYIVNYENNTSAGTATVIINGRGGYSGTVKKTFTIKPAANTITASNLTKTCSTKKQTFKLGAKAEGGAKLTYSSSSKKVTVNSSGKVTISAGFIGKATITITAKATDNYKKTTKKITVTVTPTKTTLSSVTNVKGKKLTVKWKKNTSGTGYEIQYSTDKNFKKNVTKKTISKNKTTSATYSKLTKGKTYYVRIRTYKTVSGEKIYSGWSSVKKVKITK